MTLNLRQDRRNCFRKAEIGNFILEEHSGDIFGDYRFSLDRRVYHPDGFLMIVNVGWYKTYCAMIDALSIEHQG